MSGASEYLLGRWTQTRLDFKLSIKEGITLWGLDCSHGGRYDPPSSMEVVAAALVEEDKGQRAERKNHSCILPVVQAADRFTRDICCSAVTRGGGRTDGCPEMESSIDRIAENQNVL